MRVVIWTQMEGVAGITTWEQIKSSNPTFMEARRLYTNEVNAAVRGAKKAGVKEIIVIESSENGSEYSYNSLIKDSLESGAEYVFGCHWGKYLTPFTAQPGCHALFLLGAHSMAGSTGTFSHTLSSKNVLSILQGDKPIGEIGIAASLATNYNIPLLFVSGDDVACKEAMDFVGKPLTAISVKKALSRSSCRSLAPTDACALIEKGASSCLKQLKSPPKLIKLTTPVELTIELVDPEATKPFIGKKGCELSGPRTISLKAKNWIEAWELFNLGL
jgi:D-amino peptidase